jgi:hypothetical protein
MRIVGWSDDKIARYNVMKAYAFYGHKYAYSDSCVANLFTNTPTIKPSDSDSYTLDWDDDFAVALVIIGAIFCL